MGPYFQQLVNQTATSRCNGVYVQMRVLVLAEIISWWNFH